MNIHFHKTLMSAVLVVTGIGTAQAEGLYVGGALATPDYHSSINGIDGGGNGVGGKVYGGYQFTPNIAVEAGVFDLGQISNSNGTVNTRGAFLDAVGTYEFAPHWSLLGSAGVAQGHFITSRGDDSSAAIKLGAGLQYALTQQIALRAEYEEYHFDNAFNSSPDIGGYTIGVKFGF